MSKELPDPAGLQVLSIRRLYTGSVPEMTTGERASPRKESKEYVVTRYDGKATGGAMARWGCEDMLTPQLRHPSYIIMTSPAETSTTART
ncbi:hypothetical protein CVT26_006631 [Gymnopilus dilepis]|uniref:Uncharacterized protein n=1 Tax=Gymnopilus dilepis TaxID=231916 RepID=A0A409Y338_9AGAR|nr:hypothetical protein CVT26_006631 [Gymnopilus dilepis]